MIRWELIGPESLATGGGLASATWIGIACRAYPSGYASRRCTRSRPSRAPRNACAATRLERAHFCERRVPLHPLLPVLVEARCAVHDRREPATDQHAATEDDRVRLDGRKRA